MSDSVKWTSAVLPISPAARCTDTMVCFNFGRFSARPEVNLSQASLAPPICSRAWRSNGSRRSTSSESAAAEGMRSASRKARCTSHTDGATGALMAT